MAGRPAQHIGLGGGIMLRGGEDWKRCREFILGTCNEETDGCCAVAPCRICFLWEVYGQEDETAQAEWNGVSWATSIGGAAVELFWEKPYSTCQLVLEVDGVEVYREDMCDETETGPTCRHPDGSVSTTIGYDSGTLSWSVYSLVEMPRRTGDDGCADFWCGECSCVPERLCISIVGQLNCDQRQTSAWDSSYCNFDPTWPFSFLSCDGNDIEGDIYLHRNAYTDACELVLNIPGATETAEGTLDPLGLTDCTTVNASWEFELNGSTYTISAVNLNCDSCDSPVCDNCCQGEHPTSSVTVTAEAQDSNPRCQCWDGFTVNLQYVGSVNNYLGECEAEYVGYATSPCPDAITLRFRLLCGSVTDFEIQDYSIPGAPGDYWDTPLTADGVSCDPLEFCWLTGGQPGSGTQQCDDATVDEDEAQIRFCITL